MKSNWLLACVSFFTIGYGMQETTSCIYIYDPDAYDYIYLYVKKRFEFEWYKEWFINHIALMNYSEKIFEEHTK